MHIIDFHSHILPGVDDGSTDLEMSAEMLRVAAVQGIRVQVVTPHFYAARMNIESFFIARDHAVQRLLPIAQSKGIQLRVGAEVMLYNKMSESDKLKRLCINGSNVIMIEMPFGQWIESDVDEIEALIGKGYLPMIAHVERYFAYQRDRRALDRLLRLKVIFQINCDSFTSFFRRGNLISELDNSVFVLGTNAHNADGRKPNMQTSREFMAEKLGAKALMDMDRIGNIILGYEKMPG